MSAAATTDDRIRRLERADDRIAEAEAEIDEVGRETVETVAEAYDDAVSLLDRYQGKASGTGREEFQAFVRFENQFANLVEGLPDDVPRREGFERALDSVDKRRLSESDFEKARDYLEPVEEIAGLLDDLRAAHEEYREARKAVITHESTVEEEIEELERLQELGEADLSAPTERLREPIEAYDDAVREAFEAFKREASAREVLEFVATTRKFPLIDFREPPEELLAYVRTNPAGTESIPQLLEYSEYSRSKLDHYVEDAAELKRRVATQQTYLERLDGSALTVGWPPPSAERLEYFGREAIQVCGRFAADDVVAKARTVRVLPRTVDYERLRTAAVAEDQLGPEERRRIESGDVERDLKRLREERERLADAIESYPSR